MKLFIAHYLGVEPDEARRIQKRYFHDHGTTLNGLMTLHNVEPAAFLDFVHDIDLGVLTADPDLRGHLLALPGRRIVFTNADSAYALRVLAALGLEGVFELVHDIYACGLTPKPKAPAYASLLEAGAINPTRALFVEDMARNLKPAKALGMATVWVNNGSEKGAEDAHPDFIDEEIGDVTPWLSQVVAHLNAELPA